MKLLKASREKEFASVESSAQSGDAWFVAFTPAISRTVRLVALVVMALGQVVVGAAAPPPGVPLGVVAAVLIAVVAVERLAPPARRESA